MIETIEAAPRLSPLAEAFLVILYWERDRKKSVTLDEFSKRFGVDVARAKEALRELWERNLVEAHEPIRPI